MQSQSILVTVSPWWTEVTRKERVMLLRFGHLVAGEMTTVDRALCNLRRIGSVSFPASSVGILATAQYHGRAAGTSVDDRG